MTAEIVERPVVGTPIWWMGESKDPEYARVARGIVNSWHRQWESCFCAECLGDDDRMGQCFDLDEDPAVSVFLTRALCDEAVKDFNYTVREGRRQDKIYEHEKRARLRRKRNARRRARERKRRLCNER